MKITLYRIKRAWLCYKAAIKWTTHYKAIKLSLHWFSKKYKFQQEDY
jgi:hypothetical protein